MPLGFQKTSATQNVEAWQLVLETAQGGFTLDETVLPAGSVIKAGTVMGFDEATRKATPYKGSTLQASATNVATTYQVNKNSNIAVGQTVNLAGGTPRAITAIDTSNANYDLITVGTTIGVTGAAGDAIFVVDNGFNKAKGLLQNDVEVPASPLVESVSVVIRGTVYARRIPPVSTAVRALMPSIIFSDSF